MEKSLIVANWKENLTVDQAAEWLEKFKSTINNQQSAIGNTVICPSFVLLPMMAYEISKLDGVYLGAQDVSKFDEGAYTGEVSARQLRDFVSYVIVGHSERRKYFGETNEDVARKSVLALEHNLAPIVCLSSVDEARSWIVEARKEAGGLKLEDLVLVYEPVEAISSGGDYHPDDPAHAQEMAQKIKSSVGGDVPVLYGGSVNSGNVSGFIGQPDISGVLVGQASLNAEEFSRIIARVNGSNGVNSVSTNTPDTVDASERSEP